MLLTMARKLFEWIGPGVGVGVDVGCGLMVGELVGGGTDGVSDGDCVGPGEGVVDVGSTIGVGRIRIGMDGTARDGAASTVSSGLWPMTAVEVGRGAVEPHPTTRATKRLTAADVRSTRRAPRGTAQTLLTGRLPSARAESPSRRRRASRWTLSIAAIAGVTSTACATGRSSLQPRHFMPQLREYLESVVYLHRPCPWLRHQEPSIMRSMQFRTERGFANDCTTC